MSKNLIKVLSIFISFCFILEQSVFAQAIDLSHYFARNSGQTIPQSDKFRPLHLRYLGYDNLNQDFKLLLDKGDTKKEDLENKTYIEENTQTLLKYFFIGLALPNDKFWVNLRPDSPDNILDPDLEKTDIGRIFLEADVQLKKDTAGMTSPQTPEGKAYWDKLYKKAGELFGTENITIPTITRPWIVPNEIIIREAPDNAYIYKATLKVMLEEDYLRGTKDERRGTIINYSFNDPRLKELNEHSTQLIRETIIPKLTYAVNTAKRYAPLRQVYYSLILAQWFKQKYGRMRSTRAPGTRAPVNSYIDLIDSGNLANLTSNQPYDKQDYFQQYQKSFKDGEYNLQDTVYTPMGQSIRRYMSGGIVMSSPVVTTVENKDGYALNRPYLESMHYDVIYSSLNPGDIMNVKKTSVVSSAVQNKRVDEIILEESYISAVRQIEENDRHPLPFREPLFDKDFIQETIKKLELPLTDSRIVYVTEREFSSAYKRILLITLFAGDGSFAKFILYATAHKRAVAGYRKGEEEMEKDPEMKIFPRLGAEREYHVGDLKGIIWLSVEYVDSEVSLSHINYDERIKSKIATVFKMLSKKLLVESVFSQLVTTLDDSGKIIVKVVDLDLLVFASNRFEINLSPQIEEIFDYAQQNLIEISIEKRPLIVAELGVNYCKKDDLTEAYKMFYEKFEEGNSSRSLHSVEQFKRFVETLVSSSPSEISKAPAEVFPMHTHSASSAAAHQRSPTEMVNILKERNWYYNKMSSDKREILLKRIFDGLPDNFVSGIKTIVVNEMRKKGISVFPSSIVSVLVYGSWCYSFNSQPTDLDVAVVVNGLNQEMTLPAIRMNGIDIPEYRRVDNLDIKVLPKYHSFDSSDMKRLVSEVELWGHGILIYGEDLFAQRPSDAALFVVAKRFVAWAMVYSQDKTAAGSDEIKARNWRKIFNRLEEAKLIFSVIQDEIYVAASSKAYNKIDDLLGEMLRGDVRLENLISRILTIDKEAHIKNISGSPISRSAKSDVGGVDLSALPIQTEFVVSSALGALSGGRAFKGDLDEEWDKIQSVFNAGIRPSIQRLSEYTSAAVASPLAEDKIDQVRVMLADILRRDEESQKPAPAEETCKQFLRALESG